MNQITTDTTIEAIRQDLAKFSTTDDPKAWLSKAPVMLHAARNALIRANALHQAKRAQEIVKAKDMIVRLDKDHQKLVVELTDIIEKLEGVMD